MGEGDSAKALSVPSDSSQPHRGAHTQDQESPTFLRPWEFLSSPSQGGTLGGDRGGVGPCRLSTGMSGRDPCQVRPLPQGPLLGESPQRELQEATPQALGGGRVQRAGQGKGRPAPPAGRSSRNAEEGARNA